MRRRLRLDSSVIPDLKCFSGADISVWLAIHKHHAVKRGCWPSQETIAKVTGLHRVTVNRAIKRLNEAGFLLVERQGRRCRYYLPVNEKNYLLGGNDRWKHVATLLQEDSTMCSEIARSYVAKWLQACSSITTGDVAASLHSYGTRAHKEHPKKNIFKEHSLQHPAKGIDSFSNDKGEENPHPSPQQTPTHLFSKEQKEIYDKVHKADITSDYLIPEDPTTR